MYYVYILRSTISIFQYTGCTDNLKIRFRKHNNGEVKSTKHYKPLRLIYYEACINKDDAYLREKYLKTRLGKRYLSNRLRNYLSKLA